VCCSVLRCAPFPLLYKVSIELTFWNLENDVLECCECQCVVVCCSVLQCVAVCSIPFAIQSVYRADFLEISRMTFWNVANVSVL